MKPENCVQDLHESKTVYALEEAAKSILKVEATWSGLQSKAFPQIPRVDGSLLLQDKRRTGCDWVISPFPF